MLVETTNMAKNYSHCPLKKRPVFILNDDIDEPENLSTKPEDLRITTKLAPTSPPISPPVSPVSSPATLPPVSPPAPPASFILKPEPCKPYPQQQHPMAPLSPASEHVPVHYAPTTWHRSVAPIYPPTYIPLPYYTDYMGPPSPYYTSSDSSCSPPHSHHHHHHHQHQHQHVPRQPLAPLAVRPMRYLSTDQSSLSPTSSTTSPPPPSTPEDLSETYKKQPKGIRHQCPDCGKSYSTFSGLNKHQQFHCAAGDGPKKSFSCKYCEKIYVSLGALKMHIRTHTLPCKCHLCGKAFSRPWLLQGHIRTHTGEKPFSCQHCHRAFADRSNLRAHLQTHSDVKRYSCTTCSKTFSRMSLLTKHVEGGCGGGGQQQSVVMHQDVKMY